MLQILNEVKDAGINYLIYQSVNYSNKSSPGGGRYWSGVPMSPGRTRPLCTVHRVHMGRTTLLYRTEERTRMYRKIILLLLHCTYSTRVIGKQMIYLDGNEYFVIFILSVFDSACLSLSRMARFHITVSTT